MIDYIDFSHKKPGGLQYRLVCDDRTKATRLLNARLAQSTRSLRAWLLGGLSRLGAPAADTLSFSPSPCSLAAPRPNAPHQLEGGYSHVRIQHDLFRSVFDGNAYVHKTRLTTMLLSARQSLPSRRGENISASSPRILMLRP